MRAWIVLAVATVAAPARAEPARRVEVGSSLGYALPIGSAERGGRTSDGTYGLVPIQLDAAYRFDDHLGVAVAGLWGVGIPTSCAATSDCIASLGSDVAVSVRARFFLPRLGPVSPRADAGLGYEWWTTRLADGDATSTRAYGGPLSFVGEIAAPFAIGARVNVGPSLGGALGTFTARRIESGPIDAHGSVPARALHAWISLAVRLGVSF